MGAGSRGLRVSPWTHGLSAQDLLALFGHFTLLSLLAVGGAITTAPDMHRYVVGERAWLTDAQFTASVALAQAAPGPNVLFVAVVGWNVGGVVGVLAALVGSLLPSATLALAAGRWGDRHRQSRLARAFTAGMAPLTLGLLLSTSWVLLEPTRSHGASIALVLLTVLVMLRSKLSPLWLMAAGALVGALGGVG
jgi:chromate transporter